MQTRRGESSQKQRANILWSTLGLPGGYGIQRKRVLLPVLGKLARASCGVKQREGEEPTALDIKHARWGALSSYVGMIIVQLRTSRDEGLVSRDLCVLTVFQPLRLEVRRRAKWRKTCK